MWGWRVCALTILSLSDRRPSSDPSLPDSTFSVIGTVLFTSYAPIRRAPIRRTLHSPRTRCSSPSWASSLPSEHQISRSNTSTSEKRDTPSKKWWPPNSQNKTHTHTHTHTKQQQRQRQPQPEAAPLIHSRTHHRAPSRTSPSSLSFLSSSSSSSPQQQQRTLRADPGGSFPSAQRPAHSDQLSLSCQGRITFYMDEFSYFYTQHGWIHSFIHSFMNTRMKKSLVVHNCSFIILLVECLVPTIRTLAHIHISHPKIPGWWWWWWWWWCWNLNEKVYKIWNADNKDADYVPRRWMN